MWKGKMKDSSLRNSILDSGVIKCLSMRHFHTFTSWNVRCVGAVWCCVTCTSVITPSLFIRAGCSSENTVLHFLHLLCSDKRVKNKNLTLFNTAMDLWYNKEVSPYYAALLTVSKNIWDIPVTCTHLVTEDFFDTVIGLWHVICAGKSVDWLLKVI